MEGKIEIYLVDVIRLMVHLTHFDYIISKNVKKIFCMKGGPGVGKSSLNEKNS